MFFTELSKDPPLSTEYNKCCCTRHGSRVSPRGAAAPHPSRSIGPIMSLDVSLKVSLFSFSFFFFLFLFFISFGWWVVLFLYTHRENLHGSGLTTLPTFSHFYLLFLSRENISYRLSHELGSIAALVE